MDRYHLNIHLAKVTLHHKQWTRILIIHTLRHKSLHGKMSLNLFFFLLTGSWPASAGYTFPSLFF